MKFWTWAFLLAVLFLASSNPVLAQYGSQWHGLWQGIDDETGFTTFLLMIREHEAELYNALWVRLPEDQFKIEGDSVSFQFLYARRSWMPMQGKMSGGILKGTWKRFHPQFDVHGSWHAVRITRDPNWQPWDFMKNVREDTLDLAGLVAEGMPYSDYDAFRGYWNQHIEKRYFPLLMSSLYADEEGLFRESLKEPRLRKVFDTIRQDPQGFQSTSRKLAENAAGIKSRLVEKLPWLAIDKTMVIGVSGGDFDFKVASLGDGHAFIYVSSDWLNAQPTEIPGLDYLAMGLVYGKHRYDMLSKITLGLEAFRRAMALRLARTAMTTEPTADDRHFSGKPSTGAETKEEDLAKTKVAMLEKFPVPLTLSFAEFLKGKQRNATFDVALRFVEELAAKMSDEELYRLEARQIEARFRRFLKGLAPPASVSVRN